MDDKKSDEQLVASYRRKRNDKHIVLKLILARYEKKAKNLAYGYYQDNLKSGITLDELTAVALGAIYVAVEKFDKDKGKNFSAYWRRIASNDILTYIKDNSYMYGASSFYSPISLDDSKDGLVLAERITEEKDDGIGDEVFEEFERILQENMAELTSIELKVVKFKLQGLTNSQIARKIKYTPGGVTRMYMRIIEKFRKIMIKKI